MSFYKGEKEFFPGIGKIQFEGKESKNPFAFRYYDENKIVMGKPMNGLLAYVVRRGLRPIWWRNEDVPLE